MNRKVKFTQSARKHRIGRAHALFVMNLYEYQTDPDDSTRFIWIGRDSMNRELEVIGLNLSEYFLVIHVMPTRRVRNYDLNKE